MRRPYEDLANAIIIQAIKDIKHNNQYAKDARRFMTSDWFEVLSNADGKAILKRLDEEIARKRNRKIIAEAM